MAMQFTRNYDLLNLYASGAYYWDSTKSVANNWRLRNRNGAYQNNYAFNSYANGNAPFENLMGIKSGYVLDYLPYIEFGTNGTAFSYDDYTMYPFSVTLYSDLSVTNVVSNDNSTITVTMYRTFLNSSGSEQTIREIGLFSSVKYSSSGYNDYLIAREVLATPIVVPANGYFKVPITFTVNVPQNLIPSA